MDKKTELMLQVADELTADDLRNINEAASKIEVQGARLPEAVLKLTGG